MVTYANFVMDCHPKKRDSNRVRITAGGNLIELPRRNHNKNGKYHKIKILWNIIISTIKDKLMCIDINLFYLCSIFERYEYFQIPMYAFP